MRGVEVRAEMGGERHVAPAVAWAASFVVCFVGDALFPGGNDYPAREAGVTSIQVDGPEQSKRVIEAIIACLER